MIQRGKNLEALIGCRFGNLVVLSLIWIQISKTKKRRKAFCKCDCGIEKTINIGEIKRGQKSCGCLRRTGRRNPKFRDLTGLKFGKLIVLSYNGSLQGKGSVWNCLCDCGNIIEALSEKLSNAQKRSCGCLQKVKGKDHWNWKNSIQLEDRKTKRGTVKNPQYENWRKNVYIRDNYTCQISGINGRKLAAHHLNAWNSFKEERFLLENGITLSKEIHTLFHKIYGRGGNTKLQFEKFQNTFHNPKLALAI